MKNKLIGLLCTLLTLSICACGEIKFPTENETDMTTSPISTPQFPKADKTASFSDSLMSLNAESGNRMLSPYSVKMCIAMLANGANGETKQQILNALGIDNLDKYNSEVKALLSRYGEYSDAMMLNTANSLWLNLSSFEGTNGEFISSYREKMADLYSAEVREVRNENSVEEVNNWVNEKTNGKIREILEESHRKFATILANAVYFKAAWKKPFSANLTAAGDFTNTDGTTSKIDFMHNTDTFGYYENDGVKAVKLDYSRYGEDEKYVDAEDFNFSMYLILSDNDIKIEEFLNSVEFISSKVRLTVPKFEIEYETSLTEVLKFLGMLDAFSENADFSAMLNHPAKVDDVIHKTYIKIDEDGTEAAAVTAVIVKLTSAIIDERPIKEFTADRPFSFAIRDNTSGELLFVGKFETAK